VTKSSPRWTTLDVGDTVRQQLREADLLVLNKIDLAGEARREAIVDWLRDAGATAPVVTAVAAQVEPEVVLGVHADATVGNVVPRASGGLGLPAAGAADRFESITRFFEGPVDVANLAMELTAPGSRVVRAKGVLLDLDGVHRVLQVVGRRAEVSAASAGGEARPLGRLVVIRTRASSPSADVGPESPGRPRKIRAVP
jgi:G3E family GTPase